VNGTYAPLSLLLGGPKILSRHRVIPTAAVIALAMALVLALAGCSSGGEDEPAGSGGGTATTAGGGVDDGYGSPTETTAGDAAGGSGEATLTAEGFAWAEDTLRLSKDATTLKVTNADSALHSFTAESINVDQDIQGGESADVTIDLSGATGPVDFFCKYHSDMTGKIEVT
jgi:plastocyanin